MDPQKKIWRGDPGHKYKLRNNKSEYRDSFTPFVFADSCSLETRQNYPGTLIRFPLRNEQSELSDKLYTTTKLKSILKALKDDASILFLFLRYIERIEVFMIDTNDIITKLFSVETDKGTERARKKAKDTFFKKVKQFYSVPGAILPFLQYEVTITVQDIELNTHSIHHWLVANWVGSENKEILDASQTVCSLPWLGLAAALNSHYPSRLLCFLPMPDSKEVNPPLPVCVHGTFGLTKDRRHLKWKTSDMQNDAGALWNDLLLSKMFPSCYIKFLNTLKNKCNPDKFYSFWPNVHFVNQTNWRVALRPLLSLLLQDQLFWSQNGSWVKLQSSVYVVPQVTTGQFPQVVINALIKCGKVVVVLDDTVWEAIKFIYHKVAYPFTTISPSLVKQTLKNYPSSYAKVTRAEKFELLHYCLKDRCYNNLPGLVLLPVVSNKFVGFGSNRSTNKLYICDEAFLQTRLLANSEAILVNVEAEDSNLHHQLEEIANSNHTQLQKLNTESVAMILKQLSPFQNGFCCYGAGDFYNENWLKTFWSWVSSHHLSYFVNIHLIPVGNEKNSNGFKVIALQTRKSSKFIKYSKNASFYPELIPAAEKLGCYLACSEEFEYLCHAELKKYVNDLIPASLLTIASQTNHQSVLFTQDEARALRCFIFQYPVSLSMVQQSVALNLRVFPTLQNHDLHSLQAAKCTVAGRSAAMIMLEPEGLSKYKFSIPRSPLILTSDRASIENLLATLPESCWFPTKIQIIVHVILFAIENKQLTRENVLKVTAIILDTSEYNLLSSESEGSILTDLLKSLKFIPTSQRVDLYSASMVYDPEDQILQNLFSGEEIFPMAPFAVNHFAALRQLGMKSSDHLDPSDLIRVTHLICNQGDNQAKIKRANHLLRFLSSTKGNTLLNLYYNKKPLDQLLCSISWLPVMVTPPKDYPNCLGWKGATGSQFVSAEHIHACSSPDDHKKLPYLIGLQCNILKCEGLLSPKLLASFNISHIIPVNAMIQQLLGLIAHRNDIELKKFNHCIKILYDHLQLAVLNNHSSQYWHNLSQSEVVQIDNDTFVRPCIVACSYDDNAITVGKLEPYLYILPDHLQQYRSLFCHVGVKKYITRHDVFFVLEKIASKPNEADWILVNKILTWLCISCSINDLQQLHDKIFIPVDSDRLILKPANKVAFLDEDLEWLRNNNEALESVIEDYFLAHSSISYEMACKLQLKPLNTMIANTEEFCFEQAGQSEPLTTRLNRILREYKDTSVIQELLQNADDAGATEVAVYYDTREHDSSHLFFPGMANSYGPALLFYNNAEFTEEDFESIRKIAGETKMSKHLKIGKFGVGFCSVYHITDVPSFVSGENFVVFDPTLQCLGKEIKNEFNPGIKINFQKHRLLNKSKQLTPYTGVCNFNSKERFHGTLFRFPLRFKHSKISEGIYTERNVQYMFDTVKENSSKLLMFLNSVKRMTFYRSQGDSFVQDFEVIVYKESISNSINLITCKMSMTQSTECEKVHYEEQKWLIATSSQLLKTGNKEQQHGTASVSIKFKIDEQSGNFCIDSTEGECFCYLPLNIKTGLPVHVSSNFAVMTNRRGIWKADNISTATKESNWNKMLMESVVFQAYILLLVHLQKMQKDGSLIAYDFHCLWPIYLTEINPWEYFINKFYDSILSSQQALFYSKITDSWKHLYESKFMSNDIFSIGFNSNLHSSLHQVVAILNLPVVDLPSKFWNKFENSQKFQNQIINEEQFVCYFYQDKTLAKVAADAKISIVTASLIAYANNKHCSVLPKLMQTTSCIPCSPDGKSFKKPYEIIDPGSKISKLFSNDDSLFPDENFLKQNNLLAQSLSKLGLMKSLSWTLVIDRANCIQEWYNDNQKETLNRLVILVDSIKENCSLDLPDRNIEQKLQKISFLPVMQKPQHYPLKWKGDSFGKFLSGKQLTKVSDKENSINAINACGSQIPILSTKFLPYHSYALDKVWRLLGINQDIDVIHVINQFNELLQWYETCKSDEVNAAVMHYVNDIAITVYQFLNKRFTATKNDVDLLHHLSSFKDKACVWNGKCFLKTTCISFTWTTDGPYLYKLPENLKQFTTLMKHLGIEDKFSSKILVNTLSEMNICYKDKSLPNDCQTVVRLICPLLDCNVDSNTEIFLPDENFVLRSVKKLKYNDARWCIPDADYVYCHECVERKTAISLGIKPVKSIMLDDLEIDFGEEFGQEEKLTQRLNNILRDYPRDITFLKELLQNADDAGAEKLFVILDKRYHNNEKVISEEWKHLQGPALLFWNSSVFTEEDLIGIQKIGLGSKRDDADKIGQYGIGFNVVYHYTDCPSFITNDRFCILDPHYRYIARKRMKAGRMFRDLKTLWERFPDMKSSYLQHDHDEFPIETKMGSLFRLPLRLTREDAEQSEIVSGDSFFELESLEKDFKKWISLMQEALLFVHHVCDIRFFVINDTKKPLGVMHWQDPSLVNLCNHVESTRGKRNVIFDESGTKLTVYNLRLADKKMNKEESWIIQLGEGNAANPSFDWKDIRPPNVEIRPQHGIAACMDTNFMAKSFCFLPLPGYTHLPVHVHGQFVLHSDRRCLWISSSDNAAGTQLNADTNKNWNEFLIEAIGMSYAHFLTQCIKQNPVVCTKADAIKSLYSYYKLFPEINRTSIEPWKTLAKEVYKGLKKLNPQILATLVEDSCDSQDGDQNQLYAIKWFHLLSPQSANEGYFHSYHSYKSTLHKVFKIIGMNLVDTPQFICKQFKEVGMNLPIISKESVLAYYIRFHDDIYNHHKLPCHVSKTKFKDVKYFISFIKYISQCHFKQDYAEIESDDDDLAEEDVGILEASNLTLQKTGFLITVNEHVHCLSDCKEIISSDNWKLFPESKDAFLHEELTGKDYTLSSYLFQASDSSEGYNLIYSIFVSNLPLSWHGVAQAPLEDVDIVWVKNILTCIAEDPAFKCYQHQLLEDFALIPADNNILFSSKSNLLPMKSNSLYDKAEKIMRKLNMPFVNSTALGFTLSSTGVHLPDITVATDVLKSVYLVSKDCVNDLVALSDEELAVLFRIFGSVPYHVDLRHENQSLYHIKHLPIFKTIYGRSVSLSSVSKVWVWNDSVCKIGLSEWINHIPKSVIFLDPSASWIALLSQAECLKINKISLYEVYCSYIFPYFGKMNSAKRIEHIKFISKNVYADCKYESEVTEYGLANSKNHFQAIQFIKDFKALPCIGDSPPLRCISSFYDHTQEIFNVFCDSQCFLPIELQNDGIQESLRFFGLKKSPTTDEFLNYCRHVSKLRKVSSVKHASEILLNVLFFQNKEEYQHLYDRYTLQEVSNIPFAVIENFPELNAIKTQYLGNFSITDESETVNLTKLSGSCVATYKHCVWTCRPLVKLPTKNSDDIITERMKALGITIVPSTDDIIKNLANLTDTEFADFARFHKQLSHQSATISCDLPEIVIDMLECISKNIKQIKHDNREFYYAQLQLQLKDIHFLPVKLKVQGYALVKPTQVLLMEPSLLTPYYPFLHPLINEAQSIYRFLSHIGVKMSLDFSHMQLLFELAKNQCKDTTVNFNVKRAVSKATVELTLLLRNVEGKKNNKAIHLHPLYLLNDQDILTECTKLVVFNVSGDRLVLPSKFTYLNMLRDMPVAKHWNPEELLHLLPQNVGLKSLRSILQCEMVESVSVLTAHSCVTNIEQILHSNLFKTAIEKLACCCIHEPNPPEQVTEILINFQNKLQVKYLSEVLIQPKLNINNDLIPLQNTICQEFFLQYYNNKYILSLKNSPESYPTRVFRKLSKQLCLILQLKATNCFEAHEDDEAPELTSFVCDILSCGSVFKVADVIRECLPGCDSIEQDMIATNPVLGEIIPDCWHHRLDQNIFNYFLPEEWVGYENEDGKIVYAQILHCTDSEPSNEENKHQFLQQTYTITIGVNEPIEVTVIKLYKFINELKEPLEDLKLDVYETSATDHEEIIYQATDKKTIRDAVKAAWSLPEELRRKAIKRLFLQYHPDKNPGNPHATANFQMLQREIERMENGISEEEFDATQSFRSSEFENSRWGGCFNQWSRTASSHCRYRRRDRGTSMGGMSGGWNIPTPNKDHDQAKIWIKQAEYDYAALSTLNISSQHDNKTCAATCFMSHEVAEKALKAGMYEKCGMGDATLKRHSLVLPACALLQVGCLINIKDVILLENFYAHPRFPNCYSSPTVPGEMYESGEARAAFLAATRIYEAMKQLIDDDE